MKDLSPRFCIPINMPRPRGARLIEGFSPKLGRRLQFFEHATFAVWIGLGADPEVISLCERPTRMGLGKIDPIIDFWVRRTGGEEFQLVPHAPTRPHGNYPNLLRLSTSPAASLTLLQWHIHYAYHANPSCMRVSRPCASSRVADCQNYRHRSCRFIFFYVTAAIDALIRHGFELPAIIALRRLAGTVHRNVNASLPHVQ